MPATNPPTDPVAQLTWLVDRAAIRDLISDFAIRIDDKDKVGYAANFTPDAVLELPFGTILGGTRSPPFQARPRTGAPNTSSAKSSSNSTATRRQQGPT